MISEVKVEKAFFSILGPVVVGGILTLGTWILWVSIGVYEAGKQAKVYESLTSEIRETSRWVQSIETRISVLQAQSAARDETILNTLQTLSIKLETEVNAARQNYEGASR